MHDNKNIRFVVHLAIFYFHFSSGGNVQQGIVIRRSLRAGLDEEDLSRFERDPLRYSLHYSFLNVSCGCDESPSMLLYGFVISAVFPRPHTLSDQIVPEEVAVLTQEKYSPKRAQKFFFMDQICLTMDLKGLKKMRTKYTHCQKKVTPSPMFKDQIRMTYYATGVLTFAQFVKYI